ncbi:hypothetical protein P879_00861 [Paragonimus westermani]|uniref:G-protein coupled receptors family 1 profile domain-containing protein n=1 Tax=Paragonimus westermani TaxID=34504 RepID=A0A8T0DXQ0_9TREM|nr:hypothetical protein P879_00861 [Paragonimus westermani]
MNCTTVICPENKHPLIWSVIFAILLGLLNLIIVSSNLFILISLAQGARSRLSATRKLLINAAISDLALGTLVLTPAIFNEHLRTPWLLKFQLCRLWIFLDVYLTTASISCLAAIAYDQYLAVCHALRYNQLMTGRRLILVILTPWLLAGLSSLPVLGLFDWRWITDHHLSTSSSCSVRNSGPLIRIYSAVLSFFIPGLWLFVSYVKVCQKVIANIRGQKSGVIRDTEQLTLPATDSAADPGITNGNKETVSSMRVHIGGQSCYVKLSQKQARRNESKMFAHLPSTLKCGFLIVSATIPTKKPNSEPSDPQSINIISNNQSTMRLMGIDRIQKSRKTKEPRRNLSTMTLNIPANVDTEELDDQDLPKRGSTDSRFVSFLKPPRWGYTRSFSRKSDSEFSNLRQMRRCALMPVQPRLHHSVSSEISGARIIESTRSANSIPTTDVKSTTNSIVYEPSTIRTESNWRREQKAILQFILNCSSYMIGWSPYFGTQLIEYWLPPERTSYTVFAVFFWTRFLMTAVNPFVIGSASEDLRQAFRRLIYCGHPKQEKKALKRLVLAGLGAAGIPYGRPILPVGNLSCASRVDAHDA